MKKTINLQITKMFKKPKGKKMRWEGVETTPWYIIVKLLKTTDNEKIFKAAQKRKRHITYRGTETRMAANFL